MTPREEEKDEDTFPPKSHVQYSADTPLVRDYQISVPTILLTTPDRHPEFYRLYFSVFIGQFANRNLNAQQLFSNKFSFLLVHQATAVLPFVKSTSASMSTNFVLED